MTDHTDIVDKLFSDGEIERSVIALREIIASRRGQGISAILMLEEHMKAQAAEITSLRAEAEALRKDAERYRWLADDCDGNAQDDFIIWLNGHVCSRQEFDAAIDAAIDATKGTT